MVVCWCIGELIARSGEHPARLNCKVSYRWLEGCQGQSARGVGCWVDHGSRENLSASEEQRCEKRRRKGAAVRVNMEWSQNSDSGSEAGLSITTTRLEL